MVESAGICFFGGAGSLGTDVDRWSTEEVEPHERFDYWREVRARGLFGVTAELERERRVGFAGEFASRQIGGAALVELKASYYRVERSGADIASAPGDSICVYQQLGSGGWFGGVRGGEFTIASGGFATSHTDQPYHTAPLGASGFHLRILKIPLANLSVQDERIRELAPLPFDEGALAPLLRACFSDLVEPLQDRSGADAAPSAAAPLVETLACLSLIQRGVMRPGGRRGQSALRTARLAQARRLIVQHLQDPALSPAMVANLLGVSVRHLHVLFETMQKSFSQTVTEERLERSRRLLLEAPDRLIADIAARCGFESLATYYRVFNAAYGMAPGDFRAQRQPAR